MVNVKIQQKCKQAYKIDYIQIISVYINIHCYIKFSRIWSDIFYCWNSTISTYKIRFPTRMLFSAIVSVWMILSTPFWFKIADSFTQGTQP